MFAITSAVNAYDQEGDYLEVIFDSTPTLQQLSDWYYNTKLEKLNDEQLLFLAHLKRGGGRQANESQWYYLTELKSGQKYQSK